MATAYHILIQRLDTNSIEEVWVADGLGRRMEVRKGPELELLHIDTPTWTLLWRPELDRATLLPSRLKALLLEDASLIHRWEDTIRVSEKPTAYFRIEKVKFGDRNANKLTAYYPVDLAGGQVADSRI